VLFSSHLLNEVELICDWVAMIRKGRIVLCEQVDTLKRTYSRISVHFALKTSEEPVINVPGRLLWLKDPGSNDWVAIYDGQVNDLASALHSVEGHVTNRSVASLEDIFLAKTHAPIDGVQAE